MNGLTERQKEILRRMELFEITVFEWKQYNHSQNGTVYTNGCCCKMFIPTDSGNETYLSKTDLEQLAKKGCLEKIILVDSFDFKHYQFKLVEFCLLCLEKPKRANSDFCSIECEEIAYNLDEEQEIFADQLDSEEETNV